MLKKLLFAASAFLFCLPAYANEDIGGGLNNPVGTGGSGGGPLVNLGTSATATNPQRNGEAGTGFYTAGSGLVDVSSGGVQQGEWGSSYFLLPIGTSAARPSGVNGMIRYNSTTNGAEGYINGAWATLGTGSSPVGSTLTAGQIFYGNASNQVAASAPTGDVSVNSSNAWTVLTNNGGTAFGTACAAATGTSGMTLPYLNGTNTASGLWAFTGEATVSGASSSSFTTAASQGIAGIYLPMTTAAGQTGGSILSGTNLVTGTELATVSSGTTTTSVTVPVAIASGQTIIPCTSVPSASVFVNQMFVDTTTTAATAGQNIITALTTGTSDLSTTANGISSAGQKVVTVNSTTNLANGYECYDTTTTNAFPVPAIVASFSAGVSFTLTTNLANATANSDTIKCYPNITLSSALAGSGAVANDSGTIYPTIVMSQASSGAVASGATITTTTNATNYTTGALQVTGGFSATGNAYVGQGVYNTLGNLITSPVLDSTSLAIGLQALSGLPSSSGYSDIAIGYQAMGTATMTTAAIDDTAIGYQSMKIVTSGNQDTAVGWQALNSLTTGNFDTAVGRQAMGQATVTGNDDSALGRNALGAVAGGSDNTGIGYKAGAGMVGNNQSTFVGSSTGPNTTGGSNTFIGYGVGPTNATSGTNNLLLGTGTTTDVSAAGNSNEIHIGAGAGDIFSATGTGTASTAIPVIAGTIDMPNLAASSAAQTGTVCWLTGSGATAGRLTVDTTLACLSSLEELKDIQSPITNGLAIVNRLNPFWFKWKENTEQYTGDKREQPGLGAHAVEAIDSRLVGYDAEGKVRGIRYEEMTAVLVAAIKDQQHEIDALNNQIVTMGGKPVTVPANDNWIQRTIKKALNL